MKIAAFIFSLSVLASACASRNNAGNRGAEGTYKHLKPRSYSSTLVLDSSNVFKYSFESHLTGTASFGTWTRSGRTITLLSDPDAVALNGKVKESFRGSHPEQTILTFRTYNGYPFGSISVYINGKDKAYVSDSLGRVIVREPVLMFYSESDAGYQFAHKTLKRDANDFEVILMPNVRSRAFFHNERYRVRKRSLTDPGGRKYLKQ
jgi:hypothetical protein